MRTGFTIRWSFLVGMLWMAGCQGEVDRVNPVGPGPSPPLPPPFSGSAFIDPDIITTSDTTAYQGLTAAGQGARVMFDRRVADWITVDAWLFDAAFDDGLSIEVQVNPEMPAGTAQAEAERFARMVGQLPTALRDSVLTMWIHRGQEPFGGGNNNILIHTEQAALYESDGYLEEILLHEAAHSTLDPIHRDAAGWLAAQAADRSFVSSYAQEFPYREDIAESIGPYLAVRYRADRIPVVMANQIRAVMPHRIAYLDSLGLDLYPIVP